MRVEGVVTAVSWIPSEAVAGAVLRIPFEVGLAHYDDPPPDVLVEIDSFLAADRARFVTGCTRGSRCATERSSTTGRTGRAGSARPRCGWVVVA